jgi:hypothetical protein
VDKPDPNGRARERAAKAKQRELAAHLRAVQLHEHAAEAQECWVVTIAPKRLGNEHGTRASCTSRRLSSKPMRATCSPCEDGG